MSFMHLVGVKLNLVGAWNKTVLMDLEFFSKIYVWTLFTAVAANWKAHTIIQIKTTGTKTRSQNPDSRSNHQTEWIELLVEEKRPEGIKQQEMQDLDGCSVSSFYFVGLEDDATRSTWTALFFSLYSMWCARLVSWFLCNSARRTRNDDVKCMAKWSRQGRKQSAMA